MKSGIGGLEHCMPRIILFEYCRRRDLKTLILAFKTEPFFICKDYRVLRLFMFDAPLIHLQMQVQVTKLVDISTSAANNVEWQID
ncbi:hypothetical protein TNCV_2713581 [Trichonephila clavipes]|nr:hypothetical protein TNCV_2713581 [Trichonephila clavipes]